MWMKMSILKLKPSCKDYIWGGHRLVDEYNKVYSGDVLAETWELSCHPDGPSVIENGTYKGKTLREYVEKCGRGVLGTNCVKFEDFPVLIKLIDAKDNLSIQVHPDNQYALENEGQYGKTEMWYVADCEEGAFLYYGFSKKISKEEFEKRIRENTLTEVLNAVPVKKGDVFFIEAGTIHAIGRGIVIAEIQQNSNVTYRVFDYGRRDKMGNRRELHINKALDVTKCEPAVQDQSSFPHLASCEYFTVDKWCIESPEFSKKDIVTKESFVHILILEGNGSVKCGNEEMDFCKGNSFFIPADSGELIISGKCEVLVTTAGKKGKMRVGIDLGGTNTKISLVNEKNEIVNFDEIPTKAKMGYREVVRNIMNAVQKLFEESNCDVNSCVGIGAGVPGTIDKKRGVVLYSNNICWDNVPFAQEIQKYMNVSVQMANDADCAVLGETVAGAAREFDNVVMLTLGTGVGGGIVLEGKIFDGKMIGGSELGHMVICKDGELCTCGRKGCLEAYASATALIRTTIHAMEKNPDSAMWKLCGGDVKHVTAKLPFDAAAQGDQSAQEVIDTFIEYLGIGIVNIVNIFRPQVILLGGGVSNQGKVLTDPLNEVLRKYCFAGGYAEIPEVKIAELGNKAGMIGAANLF